MANEKILNTRIQLKYDSLQNWHTANTLLKAGEVAVAYLPPKGDGSAPAAIASGVLMKVGPGNFNDLPWVSATAADVYGWAKQAELPVERIDAEGVAAGNVITSIKFEDGKIKFTTANVATSEGFGQLSEKVTNIENTMVTDEELSAAVQTINNTIATLATKQELTDGLALKADKTQVETDIATAVAPLATTEALNAVDKKIDDYSTAHVNDYDNDAIDAAIGSVADDLAEYAEANDAAVDAINKKIYGEFEEGTENPTVPGLVHDIAANASAIAAEEQARVTAIEGVQGRIESAIGHASSEDEPATGIHAVIESAIDALADTHATDKAELEGAIALKADQSTVAAMYTNAQIDELLAAKQDTIPAETYDEFGAAADALEEAKGYADQKLLDFENAYIKADDNNTIDKLNEIAAWIADDEAGAVKIIADVAAANTNASNAVSTANGAATVAGEAKELANGAVTTANEAKTAATEAQNSASASASAADASAQAAAGSAATAAEEAGKAAGSASAAASAQGAAEQAKADAEAAKSAAETAQTEAEAASASASASAQGAELAQSAAETAKGAAEAAQALAEAAKGDAAGSASEAFGAAGDAKDARNAALEAQAAAEAAQAGAVAAKEAAEASNTSATAIANEAKSAAEAATEASNAATQAVAGLHAVATSGSTDDLVAGTEIWIFNCGSATEVI